MRKTVFVGLVGLCTFGQGCSMVESGARNLVGEPAHYPTNVENGLMCTRDHNLAAEVWRNYQASHPECAASCDFGWGFRQGFADYLYSGGTGQPPPVPPRDYWKIQYQTPEGLHAIEEWYAGFKAGTEAAKATGIRERVVVPVTGIPYVQSLPSVPPSTGPSPRFSAIHDATAHDLRIPIEAEEGDGVRPPDLPMPERVRRTTTSAAPGQQPAPTTLPDDVRPFGQQSTAPGEEIPGQEDQLNGTTESFQRGQAPAVPLRPDDGPVPGTLIEDDAAAGSDVEATRPAEGGEAGFILEDGNDGPPAVGGR